MLHNPKHENFCQLTLQGAKYGWTQADIYKRAGYRATGHSAEMAASRLMKKDEIQRRIAELGEPAVRKTAVSVASLLDELEQARVAAHDDRQFSAAVAAIAGKARLSGLDRENGGTGSEFSRCESVDDVMRVLLADQSVSEVLESLTALSAQVEAYAASHATLVPAVEPARPRPNEADLSLALYRKRRGR
jgi:phage terminase small subunit